MSEASNPRPQRVSDPNSLSPSLVSAEINRCTYKVSAWYRIFQVQKIYKEKDLALSSKENAP